MTNNDDNISLDDIGAEWGKLLTQALARIALLDRKVDSLAQQNIELRQKLLNAQAELNKVHQDLLAAQGKEIIDNKL